MEYKVRIVRLDINNYKAFNPSEEKHNYSGKVNVRSKSSIEKEKLLVNIFINIEMLLDVKEDGELASVGNMETISGFVIRQEDWENNVLENNGKISIQDKLHNFLTNISYNNTRGLLRERGKDDLFGRIILPLLDPEDISRHE